MPNAPRPAPGGVRADALIEQIVRAARLTNARARDELRRELAAHFEDAAGAGGSTADAVARFGPARDVAAGLRRAHGVPRSVLVAAKVVASAAASFAVALVVQAVAHLRVGPGPTGFGLTPWYAFAVRASLPVVLAALAAWELDVEPLCVRLERRPAHLAAAVLSLFAASVATHARLGMAVAPGEALAGSAAMIAVWAATVAVASRADRLLLRALGGGR